MLMGDLVATTGQRSTQLGLPGMSRVVMDDDA